MHSFVIWQCGVNQHVPDWQSNTWQTLLPDDLISKDVKVTLVVWIWHHFTWRDLIKMHLCAVVWVGGNRSDIRSPIATNPFFLVLFVSLSLSLSGLVMLTHDRTNKNLGLLKVNCSSIHLCFPPPSLHPAAVKDKTNAIWRYIFIVFHFICGTSVKKSTEPVNLSK